MAPEEPTTTLSPLNKTKSRGSATNLLTEADDAISVQARKFMSVVLALRPHAARFTMLRCMPAIQIQRCALSTVLNCPAHLTWLHHTLAAEVAAAAWKCSPEP